MSAVSLKTGQLLAAAVMLLTAGCTTTPDRQAVPPSPAPSKPSTSSAPTREPTPSTAATAAVEFDAQRALRTVDVLAGDIGPREATSAGYRRASVHVEQQLRVLGYSIQRQALQVPAGVSWGVAVPPGRTWNVIATLPGADLSSPYVVVGAHLDTVPQAPGAEDNASGVAVLLELARLAANSPTAHPLVLVAFGAEEPRGPGDDRHHYGSRRYVSALSDPQRRALRAMMSLDRVGVGGRVPVCTGGPAGRPLQREIRAVATAVGVPTRACVNRASDHWSFEKAGLRAVRFGSTPYAEYHSAGDRPRVVQAAQLERVGTLAWEWLSSS